MTPERTHLLQLRVYWEDTDAGGVVYHANYLRFAERGRTELLRAYGLEQATLERDEGILFVVRRLEMAFKAPARLDDALLVATRLTAAGGASFTFRQDILRDNTLLVRVEPQVALVGTDLRPRRVPAWLRRRLTRGGEAESS